MCVARISNGAFRSSGDVASKAKQDVWGTEKGDVASQVNQDEWAAGEGEFAPQWQEDDPAEDAVPDAVTTDSRVAWLAPQNKLVDDAALRLKRKVGNNLVCRLFPWKRELRNLLQSEVVGPELIDLGNLDQGTSGQQRSLLRHFNTVSNLHWKEHSPGANADSLSQMAKGIAAKDKAKWARFHEAVRTKADDPDLFKANKASYGEEIRKLLLHTAQSCRAICSTPIAMAQFANKLEWTPDLITVDEAARMTEAMAMVPVAKYPAAAIVWMGDVKQFKPMAPAYDGPLFPNHINMPPTHIIAHPQNAVHKQAVR
ncbi:hypothetical protein G7Z17_g5468 [Cylindrodendrum hubeiense]|uniref:DNA2/NAM7 helicase helicase domain-containing protein n=1 Tax=Cylindrodendrum hubeiense TaxID=595255 RepID=A0A9P5H8X1_9HYPO|nr:hypothetical protein G7Z17_g5468 [Cylindrodendrum hubeiense]